MKTFSTLLFAITLLLGSCNAPLPPDPETEMEAVAMVLERYVIANETQDMGLIKQVWAADPAIVVFGTESGERLVGWESIEKAMEKQFRTFSDTYIAMTDTEIRLDPDCSTAWFSAKINYNFTFRDNPVSYEGLRFTGVLTRTDGHWYIVQSHISVPAKPRNQMPNLKVADVAEPVAGKKE